MIFLFRLTGSSTAELLGVIDVDGSSCAGFGQVMSAASVDLQCWRICSHKYHCLGISSPGIEVISGSVCMADRSAFDFKMFT